jgi:hypothetical protein
MDLRTPEMEGAEAVTELRRVHPTMRIQIKECSLAGESDEDSRTSFALFFRLLPLFLLGAVSGETSRNASNHT